MKRIIFFLGFLVAISSFLMVSCDENGEEEVDPLVGTYVFTSASFNEAVTVTIQGVDVEFPAGSNAADFIAEGLLGNAPCDNQENAAVELKENGTTFYVCLNETGEEQLGSWSINSARNEMDFNIIEPAPFQLKITNLSITETSFSGTVTNFPLPVDAGYDLGQMLPGGGFNIQFASVDLTFTRVP